MEGEVLIHSGIKMLFSAAHKKPVKMVKVVKFKNKILYSKKKEQ